MLNLQYITVTPVGDPLKDIGGGIVEAIRLEDELEVISIHNGIRKFLQFLS